jgi:hypothetical protein
MPMQLVVLVVVLGLVVVNAVVRIVRNRGIKGAMFGTPLGREIGETTVSGEGTLVNTKLKVHTLAPRDRDAGPHVGIEVIRTSVSEWRDNPIALTCQEARALANYLSQAAEEWSQADGRHG